MKVTTEGRKKKNGLVAVSLYRLGECGTPGEHYWLTVPGGGGGGTFYFAESTKATIRAREKLKCQGRRSCLIVRQTANKAIA
jgi:hypothetical protein